MASVGILGSFADPEYARNLVAALANLKISCVVESANIEPDTVIASSAERMEAITSDDTAVLVVLFGDEYAKSLSTTSKAENEIIYRTLQSNFGRLLPLKETSSPPLPRIYKTLQLFDVNKIGLSQLIDQIARRIEVNTIGQERLQGHPHIVDVISESFPGKKIIPLSGPISMADRKIGYELFAIKDNDFGTIHLIHTYEPITIRNTAEHIMQSYAGDLRGGPIYLVALRDRRATSDLARLDNLRAALGARQAWYVDDFIASRLGWAFQGTVEAIPPAKSNFVWPFLSDERSGDDDLGALGYLTQWRAEGDPILIIRGPGGAGKTQLLRRFARETASSKNANVVFISSNALLDHARTSQRPLRDFSLETIAEFLSSEEDRKAVNAAQVRVVLSSRDTLLILDGLDEIIPRLPTDYRIEEFFRSLVNSLKPTGGGRLLVSCRNAFWEADRLGVHVPVVDILPFNARQVDEYFGRTTIDNDVLLERCNKIYAQLSIMFPGGIFPFVLDLTARMAASPGNDLKPAAADDSKYYNSGVLTDDIIYHVCRREAAKFGGEGLRLEEVTLDVATQTRFLIELALQMNNLPGRIDENAAQNIWEVMSDTTSSSAAFSAIRSHPLLEVDRGSITFAYDFVQEFFLALAVIGILRLERDIDDAHSQYLASLCRLESNFLRTVARKVGGLTLEVELGLGEIIRRFEARGGSGAATDRSRRAIVGGAVNIGLQCLLEPSAWHIDRATEFLKNLFMEAGSNQRLKGMVLLAPNAEKGVFFDFSGLTISKSDVIDYDNFLRCKFDGETRFVDCLIYGGQPQEHGKVNARPINFSPNCRVDEQIKGAIRLREQKESGKALNREEEVRRFLRLFRFKGAFYRPRDPGTLLANYTAMGGRPFQALLAVAQQSGLVEDGAGMGGKYLRINPKLVGAVEDFVDQGVVGPAMTEPLKFFGDP